MSWPSIGSISFVQLSGCPSPARETLETLERIGVNGQAYRKMGKRGQPITLQAITDLTTASAADSRMATYQAMIGTRQTITDRAGNSWQNMMILDVQMSGTVQLVANNTAGPNSSAGSCAALMSTIWTVQANV